MERVHSYDEGWWALKIDLYNCDTVVLLGGSGFIGSYLSKELRKNGVKVIVIDKVEPRSACERFFRIDVNTSNDNIEIPKVRADWIINLAAIHQTPGHLDWEYFETNVNASLFCIRFCRENSIKKIIFTSSIAVYGESHDKKSESDPLLASSAYGKSKILGENILRQEVMSGEAEQLIIVRPGVVFGLGENGNFDRLKKAFKYPVVPILGDGSVYKACIYVKDLVHSLNFLAGNEAVGSIEIFNIAYQRNLTVKEICTDFKTSFNERAIFVHLPVKILIALCSLLFLIGFSVVNPRRVKKLVTPTHICSDKLSDLGFQAKFGMRESLCDWKKEIKMCSLSDKQKVPCGM